MRGMTNPAIESQACFRAIMEAMARPSCVQPLASRAAPPAPLTAELAAVAMTLADNDVTLWLDNNLRASTAVTDYLRFHTGAVFTDAPEVADIALVSAPEHCPPLAAFNQGAAQYPETSTTIVMAVSSFADRDGFSISGPGIPENVTMRRLAEGLSARFLAELAANNAQYPLGVDLIFVALGTVSALPRSSTLHLASS